ncbi:hypothetical protein QI633_21110 [Nocardioides sp. QY071]|uniref:TolB family protein n=1 Tax=Nocardioides sp. QY071 TaxID=3044187 RepID=UPI00249A9ABD|nr:hypothetical protein [Nocardioides sp. QY071]WGY01027.1 hypothetical protein QI633_21110 [Nocardioides sp. QY071]
MMKTLLAAATAAAALVLPVAGAHAGPLEHAVEHSGDRAGTVEIAATVLSPSRIRVAGARVRIRPVRPVRLEMATPAGWTSVREGHTTRRGHVAFTLAAPSATTTYRVVAPAHRVTVRKRTGPHVVSKRVRLPAWTGPARTIVGATPPGDGGPGGPVEPPVGATRLLDVSAREHGDIGPGDVVVSADGRWVAFDGRDGILPEGSNDHNNAWDVFLHDTVSGTTTLISHDPGGQAADGTSFGPRISADGRFVTFQSTAGDLAPGDDNEQYDVFVYDRVADSVELISRNGATVGIRHSIEPDISADGRYVAFTTYAANLRPDPVVDNNTQVMRVDRTTGERWAISWRSTDPMSGSAGSPSISDDGQMIAFTSTSAELVGRDDNGAQDVFVYDARTASLRSVSRTAGSPRVTAAGVSGTPRISGDGATIVYTSGADDLAAGDDNEAVDVFSYDVASRVNTLVSHNASGHSADAGSHEPGVSRDGSAVVFVSYATDLPGAVPGRGQVYAADASGRIELASARDGSASAGNGGAGRPSVSADGRLIAFTSTGTDLVPGTAVAVNRLYLRTRP